MTKEELDRAQSVLVRVLHALRAMQDAGEKFDGQLWQDVLDLQVTLKRAEYAPPDGETTRIELDRGHKHTYVGHKKYGQQFRALEVELNVDDILLAKGIPAEYCQDIWLQRPPGDEKVSSATLVAWILGAGPAWDGKSPVQRVNIFEKERDGDESWRETLKVG